MSVSRLNPGERVRDVHVTEDTLAVDLFDGRKIMVPLAWFPRLLDATPAFIALFLCCAGRQTGGNARSAGRCGGAGVCHAPGTRAAPGEQAQPEDRDSLETGVERRGSVRRRFLRSSAHKCAG